MWTSDTAPLPPKKWSGNGRPPNLLRRDHKHKPISVKELALCLPKRVWRTIKWREGAAERLSSRFAPARVCVAHRDYKLTESRPEEWLLIEWPQGENEPTKYWLSTLPQTITFGRLVDLTKLRWRAWSAYSVRGHRAINAKTKSRGAKARTLGSALRILLGFLFAGLPQSYADPATVLVEEVDAGFFERVANNLKRTGEAKEKAARRRLSHPNPISRLSRHQCWL